MNDLQVFYEWREPAEASIYHEETNIIRLDEGCDVSQCVPKMQFDIGPRTLFAILVMLCSDNQFFLLL